MAASERSIFQQYLAQTSPSPLLIEIKEAAGHYFTDVNDKKYLDLISGISVCNLGHQHPEIIRAAKDQLDKFMHVMVYGELVQKPQNDLAIALSKVLPEELNSFYFTNSGAEAVDGAMKLAKRATGKSGFIAQTDAYHGSTQGPLSLMSSEYYAPKFRPLLPNIRFIRQNHPEDLPQSTDVAALIVELVQAERGAKPAQRDFVHALKAFCERTGALLIFDEIQTGMGRTGTMFAFEHYGVVPDILLLGKALGGGMPMGAFIANRSIMSKLANFPVLGHLSTFGGHPVCCATAAKAVQLTSSMLSEFRVNEKSELFRTLLQHPKIKAINGSGLLLAVELEDHDTVIKTIQYCLDKGLFTDWFLYATHCLRISPPLTITTEEIQFACSIIKDSLDTLK